jgi:WD40 repeat protein
MAVAVLPDGRAATCGTHDGRVRLQDAQSSSVDILLACSGSALAISLSASGTYLFIGHGDQGISCWEIRPNPPVT